VYDALLQQFCQNKIFDPGIQVLILVSDSHSKSPMASPVVCVLKGKDGKGGVCLAVDYRYVNRYTIPDAYPLPDVADIVQEVGKARFITWL